jgi:hypothetical protein
MEALSRTNSVLMIFEDIHWIDPTSLEVLSRSVERLRTLRVLLIVTYRPEFEPPWIGRPHVTALTLNRLEKRDIAFVGTNETPKAESALTWERLALTEQQVCDYDLPTIIKTDRRFKNGKRWRPKL